jgi:uncharacterized protein (TIGR04255 family)
MTEVPNYKKPPVREALIDIRVDRLPTTALPELERLHEELRKSYPEKRTTYAFEGHFEMQESTVTTSQKSHGAIGYHFASADGKRVIQFRLDGFTFSQLKPDPDESWPGWLSLKEEARKAWDLYVKVAGGREISRLAVRYINQVVIRSSKAIELNDYFSAAPQIPKKLPHQHLANFFSTITVDVPDLNALAVITHAPAPKPFPGSVTVILDIAILRAQKLSLDSGNIWEPLDQLRNLKNNVFEASLKKKAKELFK